MFLILIHGFYARFCFYRIFSVYFNSVLSICFALCWLAGSDREKCEFFFSYKTNKQKQQQKQLKTKFFFAIFLFFIFFCFHLVFVAVFIYIISVWFLFLLCFWLYTVIAFSVSCSQLENIELKLKIRQLENGIYSFLKSCRWGSRMCHIYNIQVFISVYFEKSFFCCIFRVFSFDFQNLFRVLPTLCALCVVSISIEYNLIRKCTHLLSSFSFCSSTAIRNSILWRCQQ